MSLRQSADIYQQRGISNFYVPVTSPASEPVSAAELRAHLRVTSDMLSDDDAADLIAEARQEIEGQAGVAMITQTWRMTIDQWPGNREPWWDGVKQAHINTLHGGYTWLALPRWPLSSVSGVSVYDESSTETAITVADVFDVDSVSIPGRLALKSGQTWPVALRPTNAIEVTFVAGYGDAADVPAPIKRAVKQLAAHIYSYRGDDCAAGDAYHASGAASIMAKFRPMTI